MNLELFYTNDGTASLYDVNLKEFYHSVHGAFNESWHIFIQSGLNHLADKRDIAILEVGFGTGLNALLTALVASESKRIDYVALEPEPLSMSIIESLNFWQRLPQLLKNGGWDVSADVVKSLFYRLHQAPMGTSVAITPYFKLHKIEKKIEAVDLNLRFDVVYFDAFGPDTQAELWQASVFEKMARHMNPHGILVTYSAKGAVRRALKQAGFRVEKLAGPPGKREITRATLL